MADPRRRIPPTDQVLRDPALTPAITALGRELVKSHVVAAQQRAREGTVPVDRVVAEVLATLPNTACGMRAVINATGVIAHTNLGRAPLSAAALAAVAEAGGTTDVEFDLATGARAKRGRGAIAALAEAVPSAEAVHVVNNNAAALLLCALTFGGEIVISRGELVEIGDGFRIPELLASTGARLREVGTTNRTHLADYAEAVGPDTGFILKVHPSNFRVTGFTADVPVTELTELTTLDVPVVVDIGSGLLRPHPLLPDEPDATTMLAGGADLVTASGDKLLGGPQAGLVMGRAGLVERLRRHPAARALRVDKLTLAALEATLRGPLPPVAVALAVRPEALWERAAKISAALAADGIDAVAVHSVAAVGGGGAPGVELPSAAVSLPERFAAALRTRARPVVGHLDQGRCLLDLRTVSPSDDEDLIGAVRGCT
jgi:L-seryl-tRNA(Ser) seleniumtransferase